MWRGDYPFTLKLLVLKQFRIQYRNMSLGMAWSVLNPLVTMGVLTFVFTMVLPSAGREHFPVFVLCGLVPFNFFVLSMSSATTSIVENAPLVKRTPVPRHLLPIASVLANGVHLLAQMGLLLGLAALFVGPSWNWLWLPVVWIPELAFVTGLALLVSSVNVFIRDTRYVVESANALLIWLVPIFYDLTQIEPRLAFLYEYNPVSALVLSIRTIVLDGQAPAAALVGKLSAIALVTLAFGWTVFQRLQRRFYDSV